MFNKPTKKSGRINRRQFVKNTALATGGLMMTGNMALAAKAHIDGDDTIKIGLIGCGGRGTGAVVQALLSNQNVKLVAMADAFRDNLDKCYATITNPEFKDWSREEPVNVSDRIVVPEEHKFAGFDAYQKVIPLADVVILTTPPGFRPMHFEAAIRAGKHVFMEKPLAVDAPGIRKVLEVAEIAKKRQLNVVVGLQRHYQTVYRKWVELLQEGAIGDIVTSRVYWNSDGVWVRPRTPGQTEMEYQMRNWYYFNWLCGDHINEQHIHNLDVGNWVKKSYPIRAHGMGGRQVRNGKEHGEIFDHHFVEFEYADGSRMFSQCRHIKGTASRVSEAFHGTNGSAPKPGLILTKSGHTLFKHDDRKDPNPYQVEHDELFAAISKGEYKFADVENGAKSTMTAILGRMATYSGQIIEWDDAINSNLSLAPQTYAWDANPPILPDEKGYYPIPTPGKTKVI
ncbi:MAG: Gfo/Idh/MocA family oxidoreductase [Bacteroidetes bacterium]|nr:Gfo/Idh/MocA family oxidoreductase [Bacteroidota bacterium]